MARSLIASEEAIIRVWAVSLAEREGIADEDLRKLALGHEVGNWRDRARQKMADPGDDPLRWVIQPLGVEEPD